MIDFLRSIRFFIRNLIYWLPVLWDDRDWDYNYLLRILIHKLNGMSTNIREHGTHVDAEEIADEIADIAYSIGLVERDVLVDGAVRTHEGRWGQVSFERVPIDKASYRLHVSYAFAVTPQTIAEANEELDKLLGAAEEQQERLLRDTFVKMAEKIWRWWD